MTEYDALKQYDDMLDECFGTVKVAGLEYETSSVLKECDPIAYRCGFNDYCDSEDIELE